MRIEFKSASKRYWGSKALDDINLVIEPGSLVAVLGINGAGKSTMLRCLATEAMLSNGKILFDGEELSRDRLDLRRRLNWIPDSPAGFPNMDLLAQIAVCLDAYAFLPDGIEETIYELLQEFSLIECEYRPVSQLSRGQRFKAAMVAMIALDRELWLIDEPFASGVDPLGMKAFKKQAIQSVRRGNTVMYTTQILEIAETFADYIVVLNRGGMIAHGTIDEIREASSGEKTLQGFFEQL